MTAKEKATTQAWTTQQMVYVAMLACLAMILSYIERMIPLSFTVPGIKLGLANLVILSGIYLLTFRQALTLVVLKCVMTAWIFGSFSAFLYSSAGSVLSFLVMAALIEIMPNQKKEQPAERGIILVSVAGGVCHNIGQILMAALVVGSFKVLYYLPVLIIAGLLTGLLIGAGVRATLPYVINLRGKP